MKYFLPIFFLALLLIVWEYLIIIYNIPEYILPGPLGIYNSLIENSYSLFSALFITLEVTVIALILSAISGVTIAILLSQSKFIEHTILPYAVFIQVTPIVTIAPFIIIWVSDIFYVLVILAWVSSVFPIISNTLLGLKSINKNLSDLFVIYNSSKVQRLRFLSFPSALPYFLGGLRISGGLALIGTVVAEMVAGTGGEKSGLASRLLESTYRLDLSTALACFFLLSISGYLLFSFLSALSHILLYKWHESALNDKY